MKEEFKTFVRKRPELVKYVNSGKMTWQKFYEMWSIYGEDEKVWSEYKKTDVKTEEKSTSEPLNFSSLTDMVKKIDMNSVQKGVNGLQKIIELVQGFAVKDGVSSAKGYEPRQLFKKFED